MDNKNSITVILSKKGTGKSELVKYLINKTEKKTIIIWDFLGEYDTYGKVYYKVHAFGAGVCRNINPDKRTFYILRINKDFFSIVCSIVYELQDVLFVIEETDSICSSDRIDVSFEYLIRYGRHKRIDLICVSRRPANVSRDITSQADILYFGQISEPGDLQYVKKICPDYVCPLLLPQDIFKKNPEKVFHKKEF